MIAKLEWTQSNAQKNIEKLQNPTMGVTINNESTTTNKSNQFVTLNGEERAGCFALFVFLVSRDCCVALTHDDTCLSAVCDCGIS